MHSQGTDNAAIVLATDHSSDEAAENIRDRSREPRRQARARGRIIFQIFRGERERLSSLSGRAFSRLPRRDASPTELPPALSHVHLLGRVGASRRVALR